MRTKSPAISSRTISPTVSNEEMLVYHSASLFCCSNISASSASGVGSIIAFSMLISLAYVPAASLSNSLPKTAALFIL